MRFATFSRNAGVLARTVTRAARVGSIAEAGRKMR